MKLFKLYITLLFCLSIFAVSANTHSSVSKKSAKIILATEHSLVAPEGTRYQWYLNNIQIEGATEQELDVTSSGFYKVELTTFNGDVIEKNTIVGLTAAGAIIRIFTIGDSTVQDYAAGYYPRKGWGQVLPLFFNTANVSVINKAVGGTSSKSFYNSFWPAVRDGLQAGDFVFIQFGINDRNNADPNRYTPTGGEFESYLTKYVNETKAKGAHPVLVATLRRNAWNADGTVYDAYHDHPVATRTVARNLGVPLIDLDAKAKVLMESVGQTYATRLLYNNYVAGEYPNYPNGNTDQVHFQEMGAIEMAKLVAQGIRELSADPNVSKLIPYLKPEYQIAVYVNPAGADEVTTRTTTYPQGLTITLKTIPKTTSTFQKWNNAAGAQLSTAKLTIVTSGTSSTSYTAMYAGATACISTIAYSTPTTFCNGGSVVLTANTGASYKWFNGTTQIGTASTYTARTSGNYKVEVTSATGCKATSAVKTITVNPLPVVTHYVQVNTGAWTAATTASVCESNTVNLGPQPNVAAGWTWTGPNNFTSTLRNPVLTNIVVANAGNYIATYTDPNGCKASSTFALEIPKPTASITAPTTTIIPYAGSISLNAATGTGYTYQWKKNNTNITGATTASYTATTAASYTVTVTASSCSATSAAIALTVQIPPLKYVYTYDNSGNLSWSNTNSWTPKAIPRDVDTVIIRTGEVQIANLNHTAPVYVETNGILRLIDTSTVAKLYLQGGTLKAYTSAPGMMLTSNITVEQPSTIMAGSVAATIFTLNGTITGNANLTKTSVGILRINSTATGFKGNWIITEGKLQLRSASGLGICGVQVKTGARLDIEVSGASIYSLVVETGGGVDLDQTLATSVAILGTENILTGAYQNAAYPAFIGSTSTLNVSNSLVSLSGPTAFCTGNSLTLTASSGTSYIWKNNTTQVGTAAAYTTNTSGSYTVDATSAAGCKVTSAPVATVGSTSTPPTITSSATSFCTGGSAVLTASAGASYKWFNGTTQVGTDATYTAITAGAYTVQVTNASGCKATSAATQISVTASQTATITSSSNSFCTGESIVLSANTGTGLSYQWTNTAGIISGATNATYTAIAASTYTVTVSSGTCSATSTGKIITESALPTATITTASTTTFCNGSSVVLTASAGASYKWFNGTTQVGTAANYTATAAGNYTVEVTNAAGCKATSAVTTITVNALPIAIITTASTSFCTGASVTLTSSAGASYKWFNGATQVGTSFTYAASAAGSYTVEVTNSDGCKATSTAITITENTTAITIPTITASSTSMCAGGSVILSSSSAPAYKWFNGTTQVGTSSAYTATAVGTYTVEVTNASGCKATSAAIQISIASAVTWYADSDNDGLGDISNTVSTCTKPNGYVATAGDACPADANKSAAGNCGCGNTEASCVDCAGVMNGTAILDNCSICVGGTTGNTACVTTATVNGASANITVVPQPFDASTTITVENYGAIQSYTIISASGALVETRQGLHTTEITLGESIASGLYTVILTTEKGTYTTKIVKK